MSNKYLVASTWSDPQSWSLSSGGTGGAGVPNSSDDVIIGTTCNLNQDATINSLTIVSGGNLNLNTHSLMVNANVNLAGGIVNGQAGVLNVLGNLAFNGGILNSPSLLSINGNITGSTSDKFFGAGTITVHGDWSGSFNFGESTVVLTGTNNNINGITTFWNLTVLGNIHSQQAFGMNVLNDLSLQGNLYLTGQIFITNLINKVGVLNAEKIVFIGNHNQNFVPATYESLVEFSNTTDSSAQITFAEGEYSFNNGVIFNGYNGGNCTVNLSNSILNVSNGLQVSQGGNSTLTLNCSNVFFVMHGSGNYVSVKKFGSGDIHWTNYSIIIDSTPNSLETVTYIDSDITLSDIIVKTSLFCKKNNSLVKSIYCQDDAILILDNTVPGNIVNVQENLIFEQGGPFFIGDKDFTINIGQDMSLGPVSASPDVCLFNLALNVGRDFSFEGVGENNVLIVNWDDSKNLLLNVGRNGYFKYAHIKNVNASFGNTILAENSIDLGNNFNINFGLESSLIIEDLPNVIPFDDPLSVDVTYDNLGLPTVLISFISENGVEFEKYQSYELTNSSGIKEFMFYNLKPNTQYSILFKAITLGISTLVSATQEFSTTSFGKPISVIERAASHDKFPKLANQVQAPGGGDITNAVFDNLHYWDLVVLDAEVIYNASEYLGTTGILRKRNPNIIILSYFSSFDFSQNIPPIAPNGHDFFPTLRYFVNNLDIAFLLKDTSGNRVNIFKGVGWENWTNGLNYTTGIKTYLPDVMNTMIVSKNMTDGIFFDWASTEIHWFSYAGNGNGPIDMDNDGQAESDTQVNALHVAGWKEMVTNCRNLFPTETVIVGNAGWWTGTDYAGVLNGIMIENFQESPDTVTDKNSWAAQMAVYAKHVYLCPNPKLSFIMSNYLNPSESHAFVRYTLASALMFDGYFCHTNKDAGYQSARWYDEYAVNLNTGEADRSVEFKGYLGKPLGHAKNFHNYNHLLFSSLYNGLEANNHVWFREFENGLVIVNPTSSGVTLNLGTTYRKIKGVYDPTFNDGSELTSITMDARSGVILLKN